MLSYLFLSIYHLVSQSRYPCIHLSRIEAIMFSNLLKQIQLHETKTHSIVSPHLDYNNKVGVIRYSFTIIVHDSLPIIINKDTFIQDLLQNV